MLFAPNGGIVVDEPNRQAQPQCPETLARLVGYEWGITCHKLELGQNMPCPGLGARSRHGRVDTGFGGEISS